MAVIMIAVSAVALLLTLADRQLMSLASIGRDPSARPGPDPAADPALEGTNWTGAPDGQRHGDGFLL